MVLQELRKGFPLANVSVEGNLLNIVIGEEDLKKIFLEYAGKHSKNPFINLIDVRIINNKIVLSIRVI